MKNFLESTIGNELIFVYGLIVVVVILIIVIIIIDKKESKKKPQNLFDTLNMKIIANPDIVEQDKIKKEEPRKLDFTEINQVKKEDEFLDLEPIKEINIISNNKQLAEVIESIEEEPYIEEELEKTQAQLRVEEITKALEEREVNEIVEKDKYEQFEEEQEKNAIISYNELKKSFDKLYSENEKIQYLEDDEIPINIEELYKLQNDEQEKKKVTLENFTNIKENNGANQTTTSNSTSTFKSSPYISPVYGIQEPPIQAHNQTDIEIEKANQFLQTLKELKNNLD